MFKDTSKIMTWHVWKVTYLRRNVTIVCGASYLLLGSWISWDSKVQFQLQVESYVSDWQFSESQYLASYVFRHNATAYDKIWGQLGQCNGIRGEPYALETAYQCLKHFVYVYYGCMKRSEVDISLNHEVVASCSLHKWPWLPKSGANLASVTI